MKKFITILLSCCMLSISTFADEKITIGLLEAPPMLEETAPGYGLTARILSECLKDKGYEIDYEFYPYLRLIKMLKDGELYGGLLALSEEDSELFLVKPMYYFQLTFFYKKSAFPEGVTYSTLKDLQKYRIGVLRGAPQIPDFEAAGIITETVHSEEANFMKLQADRIDLASTVEIMGLKALRDLHENLDDYGMTAPLQTMPTIFAAPKDQKNIAQFLNDLHTGYEDALKNGAILKILESFYGEGKVPDWVLHGNPNL